LRGYVENVATAIALAVTEDRAPRPIVNVAEDRAFTKSEWVRRIGRAVGWNGEIVAVHKEHLPAYLRLDLNFEQQWVVDTTRLREELGYNEPIPLDEALKRTIDWERKHPPATIPPEMFDYAAEDAVLSSLK
jgi:nucleoside-diphosphate-sugar epimerase